MSTSQGMRFWPVAAVTILCALSGAANAAEAPATAHETTLSPRDHEAVRAVYDKPALTVVEKEPPQRVSEPTEEDMKPTDTAVRIPGYWKWSTPGKRYVWMPGLWREPPAGLVWHPGRWEETEGGWIWIRGYWGKRRDQPIEVIKTAPPPPRAERKPPKPAPGLIWVPGHWKWTGTEYVWMTGTWTLPPGSATTWVEGRYARRPDGYVYIPGYWDYALGKRVPPLSAGQVQRPLSPRRPAPPDPPRRPVVRP